MNRKIGLPKLVLQCSKNKNELFSEWHWDHWHEKVIESWGKKKKRTRIPVLYLKEELTPYWLISPHGNQNLNCWKEYGECS